LKCGADYWYKCFMGEWDEVCYSSRNIEDAIFTRPMNYPDKCMKCRNLLERGTICEKKYCFATGRGRCDNCSTFDPTIFDCCQEVQKAEGAVKEEEIKSLSIWFGQIMQQRNKAAVPATEPAREFDDDIPF